MKRFITCALLLTLLVSVFAVTASAKIYEGKALDVATILNNGEVGVDDSEFTEEELSAIGPDYHIQYHLDTETGELRIFCDPTYGEQKMLSYARTKWIPWLNQASVRSKIKTAIIEEGVLTVGHYSFYNCTELTTVYLPHSIYKVDRTVFYQCRALETIYYAGTEEDFQNYILWIDEHNAWEDTVKGEVFKAAKDLIHFGEHVTVVCRNQDGEEFARYTVGGYNVGDEYTITPKTYTGLTFVGKNNSVTGKFKKNDKTEIVFEYNCDHHYVIEDPSKPCADYCEYCGKHNPNGVPHTWHTEKEVARGMFNDYELAQSCTVCDAKNSETKMAYVWYIAIAAVPTVIVGGVVALTVYLIKRKKRIKEMTW